MVLCSKALIFYESFLSVTGDEPWAVMLYYVISEGYIKKYSSIAGHCIGLQYSIHFGTMPGVPKQTNTISVLTLRWLTF